MEEIIGLIGGNSGEALTDSLHKFGKKVAIIIGKDNEPGAKKADYILTCDLKNKKEILDFFIENNVKKVVIGTGHILAFKVAKYLQENNIKISVDIEASLLCKDKNLFKKFVETIGIKTPNSLLINNIDNLVKIIHDIEKNISIPCVVKSNIDIVQPQLVYKKEELISQIKLIIEKKSEVLIEEYIDGNDCTVPVVRDSEGVYNLGVLYYSKAKEYNLIGFGNARSDKMSVLMEERIKAISNKIIMELKTLGVSRIDYIIKNEDIYVLEVNSVLISSYESTVTPMYKANNINIADEVIKAAIRTF